MLLSQLRVHCHRQATILYLFTSADFKTILFPAAIFGALSAPDTSLSRVPHVLLWIWLHLLQTVVSNQGVSIAEDAVNKPWRPLPAGLIDISQARLLRWTLVPLCFALSLCYDVLIPSTILAVGTVAYNELGLHAHWLSKNFCNALGYATFNAGATFVACNDRECSLGLSAVSTHLKMALVVLTTIHAQDFRDIEGDKKLGSQTIPIRWTAASRATMPVLLLGWSIGLSIFFGAGPLTSLTFIGLGGLVGVRFARFATKEDDGRSHLLYNIWLTLAPLLLFFAHASP